MKKVVMLLLAVFLLSVTFVLAAKCATIQKGELHASTGEILTTGFDNYGYNYQAHQYLGLYGNYQRPPQVTDEGYKLMMKWNDAWLANSDCNGDGLLDRHYGFPSYDNSEAWLTNHMSGEYVDGVTGELCNWTYFVKIISTSSNKGDYKANEIWYTADGAEIGPVIWGEFAITEEINNDPCAE